MKRSRSGFWLTVIMVVSIYFRVDGLCLLSGVSYG